MAEEFDSFDYLEPADYLPALQENYRQQNEGFERAEEMARLNDQQRLADAQNYGRLIDNVGKFSKAMKGHLEKQHKKRDLQFRNEATNIALQSGISLEGWQKYKEETGKLATETGYYNSVAQQFKETNFDLYEKLTSLTGWKAVSFKRNLLRQAGLGYTEKFYSNINKQDAKGNHIYSVNLGDRVIHWGNAADSSERDMVMAQYNKKMGLTDVSWANAEFLKTEFQPIYDKAVYGIRAKWTENKKTENDQIRLKGYDEDLITAANPNINKLGAEVERMLTTEYGHYGDPTKAREAVVNRLAYLVQTNKIPAHALYNISDHLMSTVHRGTGKQETLGFFKEFNKDNLTSLVVAAQKKQNDIKLGIIQNRKTAFSLEIQSQFAELGRPPTEAEAAEIIMMWTSDPINAGIQPPEFVKTLSSNTLEDRNDDEIIAYHTINLYNGNKPPAHVINSIQDQTKREAFKKLIDGFGLDSKFVSIKNARIKTSILKKLGETVGFDTDPGSEDYQIRSRNALRFFDETYAASAGKVEEGNRFDHALQLTLREIESGNFGKEQNYINKEQKFARNLTKVKKNILEQKNNGVDLNEYVSTTLLPGSEEQFKRLENYVKDPIGNQIPFFYKELARDMKVSKDGIPMTGWHLANLQYKAVTGKELPKPNSVLKLESGSAVTQYLRTWKNNRWNTSQANYIDSGGSWTNTETLTPGLTVDVDSVMF